MGRRGGYSGPPNGKIKVGHFNRRKWDINPDAYRPGSDQPVAVQGHRIPQTS
jgi:hypothetical protein